MMDRIEIIKDKLALEGTCYIELSVGKYQGKHWENTSLFFDEETFAFIEAVFERNIPDYDHYGMNDAGSESWRKIVSELEELNELFSSASEYEDIVSKVSLPRGCLYYFQYDFQLCKDLLEKMISELITWVEINIEKHACIAVLGI